MHGWQLTHFRYPDSPEKQIQVSGFPTGKIRHRQARTEGLMLVFDGGVLTPAQTGQIRLPADELRGWAWCTEREAAERLSELLARRVTAAARARAEGTMSYLEDGFLVA